MLRLIRDHAKTPLGGHGYAPSGIRGGSIDEVLNKMSEYRAANALPLGDPEQDLAEDYLLRARWLVKDCPDREITFGQKVAETTMAIWRSYPKKLEVRSPEVESRLGVCAACPHACAIAMPASTYGLAADNRAVLFTGLTHYASHKACDHHKWMNAMGVLLKHPLIIALLPSPQMCWVQKD